jgi:hypothetical protein
MFETLNHELSLAQFTRDTQFSVCAFFFIECSGKKKMGGVLSVCRILKFSRYAEVKFFGITFPRS